MHALSPVIILTVEVKLFFVHILNCVSALYRYCYPMDPNYVNYVTFSDEMESVFTTKGLEKTPTAEVDVFVPPGEVGVCPLSQEEREMLNMTMQKLAEKVNTVQ